jgi:hypothetical protein
MNSVFCLFEQGLPSNKMEVHKMFSEADLSFFYKYHILEKNPICIGEHVMRKFTKGVINLHMAILLLFLIKIIFAL